MPEPGVRLATVDDAATVADLLRTFNAEFETPAPPADVLAERMARQIGAGEITVLLAHDEGEDGPTGFAVTMRRASVWYDGPVVMLEELFVHPHLRSRGIGARLLARVLTDAQADGCGAVEITVDEGDDDAMRFYVREGFSRTEPGDDERAWYIWREL